MPGWLIIIVSILGWAIWPGIIAILHHCDEKQYKKNKPRGKQFIESLKEDDK